MTSNKTSGSEEEIVVDVKPTIFSKFSLFFFKKNFVSAFLIILIFITGTLSYTTWFRRDGFPPISFPLSFVGGAYPGQSAADVDAQIVNPLSQELTMLDEVDSVNASAGFDGSFSVAVFFSEGLTSDEGTEIVNRIINDDLEIPEGAIISAVPIDPGSYLFEYDMVAHVYSTNGASAETLDIAAQKVAGVLTDLELVDASNALSNFSQLPSGQKVETSFTRIGTNFGNEFMYYDATAIGIKSIPDTDILKLSQQVNDALEAIDLTEFGQDVRATVSADFATSVDQQLDFLESNLLTSLIAVAFVSFILITWRASIITGLFMVLVMLATLVVIYLIGYTLNVITLFGLILSLGLFVDDATIVVEAIDVNRHKKKLKAHKVVVGAVNKVGAASLAGTLTTMLVFAILASPSGILGEFIRLIPITVIVALGISYILSITVIPFMAKFLMLRHNKISWLTRVNPVIKFEKWLGEEAAKIILMTRKTSGKIIGAAAMILSIVLMMVGGYMFGFKVDNNTFPPSKDTNQLGISVIFNNLASVAEAKEESKQIDDIIIKTIGDELVYSYFGIEQLADARQATIVLDLVPFTDREVKSPELTERLESAFAKEYKGDASIAVNPIDNGPPASQFPFGIRVYGDDTQQLAVAIQAISDAMVGTEMENYNGEKVNILASQINGLQDSILRDNGDRYAIARFSYDSENPTVVSLLTEENFRERFDDNSLSEWGITYDDLEFDAGQEGDFQDSFDTLLIAIPISLLLMFILLAVQFRSILKPFLILLAVPFTIFGVALGLYLTNNAASFFALVGFVGLTGIAVNNTIMLTDYANQEKRLGKGTVDAIAEATRKRLRPLIATTLTTMVALLPLALTDPFWEPLAVTIIFGLFSSTVMVILSFPYYYIVTDKLADYSGRKLRALFKRGASA
jgi:multidrug efflux pump subunit AcrB